MLQLEDRGTAAGGTSSFFKREPELDLALALRFVRGRRSLEPPQNKSVQYYICEMRVYPTETKRASSSPLLLLGTLFAAPSCAMTGATRSREVGGPVAEGYSAGSVQFKDSFAHQHGLT